MTFPRALARCTHGAVNTMTLHLAGHAAFADLEHTAAGPASCATPRYARSAPGTP